MLTVQEAAQAGGKGVPRNIQFFIGGSAGSRGFGSKHFARSSGVENCGDGIVGRA